MEDIQNTDRWKKEVGHPSCQGFQMIGEENPEMALKTIMATLADFGGFHADQGNEWNFWYCDICAVYSLASTINRSEVCCAEAQFVNLRYPDKAFVLDTVLNAISDYGFLRA